MWMLHLSGDFLPVYETELHIPPERLHLMRAMMTSNLAVSNGRFRLMLDSGVRVHVNETIDNGIG